MMFDLLLQCLLLTLHLPVLSAALHHPRDRGGLFIHRSVSSVHGRHVVDLTMGVPRQRITLQLDTGSPLLWVNPTCATSGDPELCDSLPRFDGDKSSMLVRAGPDGVRLKDEKGSVESDFVKDKVRVGSAELLNQTFGIASQSTDLPVGILGLSPFLDAPEPELKPLVLDHLAAEGHINSAAFSLDLREASSDIGSITFGGLDRGKFEGTLRRLPLIPGAQDNTNRYWVEFDGVSISQATEATGKVSAYLDSSATITELPTEMFRAIGEGFGLSDARLDNASGLYAVDCAAAKRSTKTMDFLFGQKRIRVSFADMVLERKPDQCVFGVKANDKAPVLGEAFLRAAYVVFDKHDGFVHVAQAANCGQQLEEIPAAGLPADARGLCTEGEPEDEKEDDVGEEDRDSDYLTMLGQSRI